MANYQIDAIRMSPGGSRHEHITHIFGQGFGSKTRFEGVSDIFYNRNSFFTSAGLRGNTPVHRMAQNVQMLSQYDYLQTVANGVLTDNLLSLPRR